MNYDFTEEEKAVLRALIGVPNGLPIFDRLMELWLPTKRFSPMVQTEGNTLVSVSFGDENDNLSVR